MVKMSNTNEYSGKYELCKIQFGISQYHFVSLEVSHIK